MINWNKAEYFASYGTSRQLPPADRPEIVFAGRSNVGKSSLINKLCNRKGLARTSASPGKTATINFYHLPDVCLADLPGYGYAKVNQNEKRRWAELMEGFFADERRDICLVLQLLDIRHDPTADDRNMIDFLIDAELPFLVVLTKSDKLSPTRVRERVEAFRTILPYGAELTILPFSSETGSGVNELREILEDVTAPEDETV